MNSKIAESGISDRDPWKRGPQRVALWLILGWIIPAVFVYGPSCFLGIRINLPADLLHLPGHYIPSDPATPAKIKSSTALMDLVHLGPSGRQFIADEYRAGRLPLWNPHIFCGAPFPVATKYSPFELPYILFPTPKTLVWMQLLQNFCIGAGTWFFLRKSIGVSPWSGIIASWASPWLGFLTVWQGFTGLTAAVCWLPWLLLLTDYASHFRFQIWTPLLGLVTAIMILSGAADIAALVLVTCGLRLVWKLVNEYVQSRSARSIVLSTGSVCLGWFLGLVIASPFLLPLVQYSRSGSRMEERASGAEERPPIGIAAVWSVVFPERYGGSREGLPYVGESGNILESSSGAFAGGVVLSLMLPIAAVAPWRRKEAAFWIILCIAGLSWQLALPILLSVQRTTPLNLLSWSRWVFASSFSMLVLASLAFDEILSQRESSRNAFRFGMVSLIVLLLIDLLLLLTIPEPFGDRLGSLLEEGFLFGFGPGDLSVIQEQAVLGYLFAALSGTAALAAMFQLLRCKRCTPLPFAILAVVVLADLLWFARVQVRTGDPLDYFPQVPALDDLSKLPRARVIGIECLPANLSQMAGLSDVRGYDAVDPHDIVRLLKLASDPSAPAPPYARTQWMIPLLMANEGGRTRLSPILDMLNLRYVIVRAKPLVDWPVVAQSASYWVLENTDASPRAFVPSKAVRGSDDEALSKMATLAFKPLEIAYLEESEQPVFEVSGKALITKDLASCVELNVEMNKEGILVLADSWAPDWTVQIDGEDAQSLRVNTALRGVRVPAGMHTVVWTYWPALISKTLPWSLASLGVSFLWCLCGIFQATRRPSSVAASAQVDPPALLQ